LTAQETRAQNELTEQHHQPQEFIMTMTKTTKQATARLTPTIVTKSDIGTVAFDGQRRRPILAINDDGELVVCCRATARIHGWKVEGQLHVRPQAVKVVKSVEDLLATK